MIYVIEYEGTYVCMVKLGLDLCTLLLKFMYTSVAFPFQEDDV